MISEGVLTYWIYTHAVFGFVALSVGFIALSSKKGRPIHRRSGKIFAYSMVISSVLSLIIATQPNHPTLPFLEGNVHVGIQYVRTKSSVYFPKFFVHGGLGYDFLQRIHTQPYPFIEAGLILRITPLFR